MDDILKISILRNFTARQAELAGGPPIWRWNSGVALFPEARCPYCRGTMQSNRIWQISEENRQLLGRWKLEDGRLRRERGGYLHPHVNGTGVCTGLATPNRRNSVLTALFLGINPGDSYWGGNGPLIKGWLSEVFDHLCPPTCGHRTEATIAACPCDYHRIQRGEVRCRCGAISPLGEDHICICVWCAGRQCTRPCRYDCGWCELNLPGGPVIEVVEVDELPEEIDCDHSCCRDCCENAGCGHIWDGDSDDEEENEEDCGCSCACNPTFGSCGCGHVECRCDPT